MSLYLDLLPAPQFDRSLVAYTVGNFQRIKDLLVKASGRVYVNAFYGQAPYPVSITLNTPFKSDVLVHYTVAGYAAAIGLTGVNIYLDGAGAGPTLLFYFNNASVHSTWTASFVYRNQAAGSHIWKYDAGGGLLSDGNDKVSWLFTYVEVP